VNENELKQVIEEGEGYRIEFKQSLANLEKELVAFANSSGGNIFVGITDNKEIKGVRITNKFKSQVQDIANNCQPAVKILFEELGNVLLVWIGMRLLNFSNQRERSGSMNWLIQDLIMIHI